MKQNIESQVIDLGMVLRRKNAKNILRAIFALEDGTLTEISEEGSVPLADASTIVTRLCRSGVLKKEKREDRKTAIVADKKSEMFTIIKKIIT